VNIDAATAATAITTTAAMMTARTVDS
jgi:hypothetical protein